MDTLFYCLITSDYELDSIKLFISRGFIILVYAFYYVLQLTLEKSIEGAADWSVLHLFVQLFTQDAVELVDILLLVNIIAIPSKCLKELMRSDKTRISKLKVIEYALQAERNGTFKFL